MPDEPMAEQGPEVAVQKLHEILFDACGIVMAGQVQTLSEARDMGIDDDAVLDMKGVAENDIGGLASNAVQVEQGIHGGWHLAIMALDQFAAGGLDMAGFGAEKPETANILFELLNGGLGVIGGRPVFPEKDRGDKIDLFIGALRGEDGGDEEFEG
jgi:hypothetical protein